MSTMYGVIGTSTPKNLLADPQGADKFAIPCEPGAGDVAAGTLMYRKESGLWAPAAAAQVTAANQLAVLKDDVATGDSDVTVAEDAVAYRAGEFIDGAVTLKDGAALTEANKAVLRGQNIVFTRKESTGTFNNTTGA